MKTPFEQAWHAFEEHDRSLRAPAPLEARVLAAVESARTASQPRAGARSLSWLAAAAALALAIGITLRDNTPPPAALSAQPHALVMMPPPVEPVTPRIERESRTPTPDDRVVLVMLDTTPPLPSEPLQLVRLRVPKEALLGLGLLLFEQDAEGMVDVDVLVGEDGLPRDVRRVRLALEDRQ